MPQTIQMWNIPIVLRHIWLENHNIEVYECPTELHLISITEQLLSIYSTDP